LKVACGRAPEIKDRPTRKKQTIKYIANKSSDDKIQKLHKESYTCQEQLGIDLKEKTPRSY